MVNLKIQLSQEKTDYKDNVIKTDENILTLKTAAKPKHPNLTTICRNEKTHTKIVSRRNINPVSNESCEWPQKLHK